MRLREMSATVGRRRVTAELGRSPCRTKLPQPGLAPAHCCPPSISGQRTLRRRRLRKLRKRSTGPLRSRRLKLGRLTLGRLTLGHLKLGHLKPRFLRLRSPSKQRPPRRRNLRRQTSALAEPMRSAPPRSVRTERVPSGPAPGHRENSRSPCREAVPSARSRGACWNGSWKSRTANSMPSAAPASAR